jgi:hypothetical protein
MATKLRIMHNAVKEINLKRTESLNNVILVLLI